MNYIEYLNNFSKFKTDGGFKPGLERVQAVLNRVGNPEKKVKIIHVAGTNGKGSTSVIIANILKHAGYQVGFYSSPHLQSFNERFRLNGKPITDQDLEMIIEMIKPAIAEVEKDPILGRLSYFEVLTIIAFAYYAQKRADALVLEVGLGGRLDATNVAVPLAAVITSIGYDHTEYLGNTLGEIAFEKAGIIKEGIPVITGVLNQEALAAIKRQADLKAAPLFTPLSNTSFERIEENLRFQKVNLRYDSQVYDDLKIALLGDHQIRNAVVALKALDVVKTEFSQIDEAAIRQGLQQVRWPGRLELVKERPPVLIDGAHNLQGIVALAEFLGRIRDQYDNLYLVVSVLKDKDVQAMIKTVTPIASEIIFTQNHSLRASKAKDMAQILVGSEVKLQIIADFTDAITEVIKKATAEDLICITGSLYTIAEARGILLPTEVGVI